MSKKRNESEDSNAETPGFEKALSRLEAIVQEMEGGRLSLEEMLTRFEEGQSLVKICSKKLEQVERRIETLVKIGDTLIVTPFEEGKAAEAPDEERPSSGKDDGMPF